MVSPRLKELTPEAQLAYGGKHVEAYLARTQKANDKIAVGDLVGGYSEHSSNCYTYAGSVNAQSTFGVGRYLNKLRAIVYSLWALYYSKKMLEAAGGIRYLSAPHLDVRASILRLFNFHADAIECCELGLALQTTSNTRMLLEIGLASSFSKLGRHAQATIRMRGLLARLDELNIEDQPRFYRAYAEMFIFAGDKAEAKKMIDEGQRIAFAHRLQDQHDKLEALRSHLKNA